MRQKSMMLIALLVFCAGMLGGSGLGSWGAAPTMPEALPLLQATQKDVATLLTVLREFPPGEVVATLQQIDLLLEANEQALIALTSTAQAAKPSPAGQGQLCGQPHLNEVALREAMTRLLRDELRVLLATQRPRNGQTPHEAEELSDSVTAEENQQAYEEAQDMVAHALAAGRWTDADVQAIRPILSALTPQQFRDITVLLRSAISRNELVLEARGGLF